MISTHIAVNSLDFPRNSRNNIYFAQKQDENFSIKIGQLPQAIFDEIVNFSLFPEKLLCTALKITIIKVYENDGTIRRSPEKTEEVKMEFLKRMLYGAVIGVANVIPGVSGGTMAVILGIYDKLLESISFKNLKRNILFLLPVALGGGAGILALSKTIKFVLANYPIATNFAFIGLILGSIPMIWKRARNPQGETSVSPLNVVFFAAAFALMLLLAFLNRDSIENTVQTQLTPVLTIQLFFASIASAFSMLLPGISGSFVMLLLGCYSTIISAVSDLNIILLLPVAAGCVVGLLLGALLISKLMKKYPQAAYMAILGLIAGSLFSIYPGFVLGAEGIIAILLMALFAFISWWFSVRE